MGTLFSLLIILDSFSIIAKTFSKCFEIPKNMSMVGKFLLLARLLISIFHRTMSLLDLKKTSPILLPKFSELANLYVTNTPGVFHVETTWKRYWHHYGSRKTGHRLIFTQIYVWILLSKRVTSVWASVGFSIFIIISNTTWCLTFRLTDVFPAWQTNNLFWVIMCHETGSSHLLHKSCC